MKRRITTSIITAMALTVSVLGQPNLIVNGDFETPLVGTGQLPGATSWDYFTPDSSGKVGGWSVQITGDDGGPPGPDLEFWNTNMAPSYSGDQYVELDGFDPTKISQVISTIPGAQYELSYAWRPRAGVDDCQMKVWVDVAEVGDHSGTSDDWTSETYLFVAASASTTIAFAEVGPDDQLGMLLDAVSLVLVVDIDIKPTSCPNPLNIKSKGVLPVAVLGADDFDVKDIDPAVITLEGVSPLRWSLEDVATPFDGDKDSCDDCTEDGADGFTDLTLKFDRQEIVAALGDVEDGDCMVLTLEGQLMDGTPIIGRDVVVILKKGKGKK